MTIPTIMFYRATFKAWLEGNRAAKIASASSNQEMSTGTSNQQQDDPVTQ